MLKGRRSLKRRSIYRKATEKANLCIAIDNVLKKSNVTNSIDLTIINNSVSNSPVLTSNDCSNSVVTSNNCKDTHSVNYDSSIGANEFSNTSDLEIFHDMVASNCALDNSPFNYEEDNSHLMPISSLEDSSEENSSEENSNINNNTCIQKLQHKNISSRLKEWAIKHQITHLALNDLLKTLRSDYSELPLDARTLWRTPRNKISNLKVVEPGIYYHFGLQQCIEKLLSKTHYHLTSNVIEILINIDGLPLTKSTNSQLYPILCCIFTTCNVDIVGIYHGNEKPNEANVFLKDLVEDINNLTCNGIYFKTKLYSVKVKAFICDAPAKSFITYTKGHSGYYSCTKCYERGTYINDRVCFPNTDNLALRCDYQFRSKYQNNHHVGTTILETIINIDMIYDFPLDYMHLICLGVVKKLLMLWVHGKPSTKLSRNQISNISELLLNLVCNVTIEFNRKPRDLNEVKRWKATEFRQFVLYTGPVVLKSFISHDRYINFLSLHIATSILCNPDHIDKIDYARSVMKYFVKTFMILYGKHQVSHNIHNLLHICDDVAKFGALDQFSAFKFENYLQSLKKLVRKPEKPLQQIVRRKYEVDDSVPLFENNLYPLPTLKKQHNMGPIINNTSFFAQYKEIILNKFVLKITEPDNCCYTLNNKVINIRNIITTADSILLIAEEFLVLEDFYTKPIKSSLLDIYIAKNLGPLTLWRLDEIRKKGMKLRFKDTYVIFPLLHSTLEEQ